MRTEYINVDDKWGVIVCYDYSTRDFDDLFAIMRSFGMSEKKSKEALNVLEERNTGMCISNDGIRMSAIFVSNATSPSEWWSTALHELRHSADAIISYYGVENNGEDAAYLTGFLTKELVESVGHPCY